MSKGKRLTSFVMVILDEEKKLFVIAGPMADDTEWNHRVDEAQRIGRPVRIYGTWDRTVTKEQIISETRTHTGYAYTDSSII